MLWDEDVRHTAVRRCTQDIHPDLIDGTGSSYKRRYRLSPHHAKKVVYIFKGMSAVRTFENTHNKEEHLADFRAML